MKKLITKRLVKDLEWCQKDGSTFVLYPKEVTMLLNCVKIAKAVENLRRFLRKQN